ncbi:MAG: hypothetical protein LUG66_05705 [Clostridiales bacterium]|nr:hypothetical protein [Clostridiales bacterium]
MALYDFQRMLKRLWLFYALVFALHIAFFKGSGSEVFLMFLGLLVTAAVSFKLFYDDYCGKNSLLINSLPLSGGYKVFSKLMWGVLFSVLFYCVFNALSVLMLKSRAVVLAPIGVATVFLFILNGYSAMTLFKNSKGKYMFLLWIVLFNVFSALIMPCFYMFSGLNGTLAAVVILCVIQFIVSSFNVGK